MKFHTRCFLLRWAEKRPQPIRAAGLPLPRGHGFVVYCVRTGGCRQGHRWLHVLSVGDLTKEVF
jgi:hypothetical protein